MFVGFKKKSQLTTKYNFIQVRKLAILP